MKLKWLGHACFKLTTEQGTQIVIDPYDDSVGYGTLKTTADILVMSHMHHDHSNEHAVKGYKTAIAEPGNSVFEDVQILTELSFHDDCNGLKRGKNLLTRIIADGQSIIHLGDLGHEPDNDQLAFIADADVLLIPIGGFYTINTQTALKIIENANPKAVVPMHYKTADNQFPISTAEEFIAKTNAEILKTAESKVGALRGSVVMQWGND